jgi:hypothetical protein
MTFDSDGDAMEYNSQPYSVNCEKCCQPGERMIAYCGPEQRNQNYDVPVARTRRFGRILWKPKSQDSRECPLDGEHFHLYCTHCQFKWTEPLPDA